MVLGVSKWAVDGAMVSLSKYIVKNFCTDVYPIQIWPFASSKYGIIIPHIHSNLKLNAAASSGNVLSRYAITSFIKNQLPIGNFTGGACVTSIIIVLVNLFNKSSVKSGKCKKVTKKT